MLPLGPTRLAVWMVWFPAPQAKSRTRMPVRMPAISISVSVAADRPAEKSCSHFAQPGAAFSQVLRSSDFVAVSAALETGFSEVISFPAHVRRPPLLRGCQLITCEVMPNVLEGEWFQRVSCPLWVKSGHVRRTNPCPLYSQ